MLVIIFELDFFFFQAEDGIRDTSVTGVQTCALPIYVKTAQKETIAEKSPGASRSRTVPSVRPEQPFVRKRRSEERRVGKECRSRWWRYDEKEKKKRKRTSRQENIEREGRG